MFCESCGRLAEGHWLYCRSCGARLPREAFVAVGASSTGNGARESVTATNGRGRYALWPPAPSLQPPVSPIAVDGPAQATRTRSRAVRISLMVLAAIIALGLVAGAVGVDLSVRSELSDTRRTLGSTQDALTSVRDQLEEAAAELSSVTAERDEATSALNSAKGAITSLNGTIQSLRTKIAGLEGTVDGQRQQITVLRTCVAGLVTALDAVSIGDYWSAVAALQSVEPACTEALSYL